MNYDDFENEVYGNNTSQMTYEKLEKLVASKVLGSIGWMIVGLAITGIVGFITIYSLLTGSLSFQTIQSIYVPATIIELVLVFAFTAISFKAKVGTLRFVFILYSALNGFTLSILGIIYTEGSLIFAFIGTLVLFIVLGLYGYFTKEDLSKYGTILKVGLIALIIMSLINMFMASDQLMWISSILGVIVFIVFIAYDINRIKNSIISYAVYEDASILERIEIIGALRLYLDFINLFIYILRIIGRRRR